MLTSTLRREHQTILEILSQVRQLGAWTPQGRKRLLSAKDLFINHVKKEDEFLYPPLHQAAIADSRLRHKLAMLANDMTAISKQVFEFFEKYTHDQFVSENDFIKDYSRLSAVLSARIAREESLLYPEFEQRV